LTLYYRLNGAGAWNPIVLTNSSLNFTGNIPAQPIGTTVEYYFIVHDSMNTPTAFFPITYNPALPVNQRTIPFQFAVGVVGKDTTNFETVAAGWSISSNPGDDATAGLWQRMAPIPSSTIFTSWPNSDHTTGAGKCLVTGSGTGGSGFTGVPVHGGTTTVISPVFDVSGYSKPVVAYYRWFSNEQDFSNFKKDPWIVKIRDASNATWITLENTYQADVNWRRRIFPVSQYLPTATHVQMKFFASDSVYSTWASNGQTITVGAVDDFVIYDQGDRTGVSNITVPKADIFPNPADDNIQILLPGNNTGRITLYDMTGKKITGLNIDENTNNYSINTKGLATGNYNLVIEAGKSIQSKKVVVMHP
jgi:Secretion system C-terminal sorting domain